MKVLGKVVVVTGAGSGVGREVAQELLRRGARVAAVDINEATVAETAGLATGPLGLHRRSPSRAARTPGSRRPSASAPTRPLLP